MFLTPPTGVTSFPESISNHIYIIKCGINHFVEAWVWISNFIPHFPGHAIIFPCWVNNFSKSGPRRVRVGVHFYSKQHRCERFFWLYLIFENMETFWSYCQSNPYAQSYTYVNKIRRPVIKYGWIWKRDFWRIFVVDHPRRTRTWNDWRC